MNDESTISLNGTIINDFIAEDDFDWAAECSEINVTEEEAAWTPTTINHLLDEILKKKKTLHNPRHRYKKFFGEIHELLLAKGFYFTPVSLSTKFNSLKKTFWSIGKNQDNGYHKPITWPYYAKMLEIFAEELDIEDAPTMASLYPDPPLPKNAAVPDPVDEIIEEPELPLSPASPLSPWDAEPELVDDMSDGTETEWCHRTCVAFLQECCNKKYEFSDPTLRRRKIFNEIRHRLKGKGYTFHPESLDRKLRNLKRHFHKLRETARRAAVELNKRTRITWPYYPYLKEIYGAYDNQKRPEDEHITNVPKIELRTPRLIKLRPTASKPDHVANVVPIIQQNTSGIRFIPVITNSDLDTPLKSEITFNVKEESTQNESMPCTVNLRRVDDSQSSSPKRFKPSSYGSSADSFNGEVVESVNHKEDEFVPMNAEERLQFSQELLALEKRRTIVAEGLLEEFRQLNHIKAKRIEFNRIKLEYALSRAKLKENKS